MSRPSRPVFTYIHSYGSVNVTTSAFVELVSSVGVNISALDIWDSSGRIIDFSYGASGSEQRLIYIPPGGNCHMIESPLSAGMRLAIKAYDATANSGYMIINGYA